jgi:hypothetical protein
MKTQALIDMLARGAGPAPRAVAARRLLPAAAAGVLASAALAIGLQGPLPAALLATPAPWIKLAYALGLAAAAGWLTARLARPVAHCRGPVQAVLGVLLLMALVGLLAWAGTPVDGRRAAVMGQAWLTCPWNVLLLSTAPLALALWAVRGLAPTRLRAAGGAAGLLAGALGALGYSLSCPEASPTFVAVWYTAGVALTGTLGAALGPRVLRW